MNMFDPAQAKVLWMMEKESLSTYLESKAHKQLTKRIQNGEMDELLQEDIERVKDIMSKEVIYMVTVLSNYRCTKSTATLSLVL